MPINSLRALKPRDFDYWTAQHLLNRAGFGGTPDQVQAVAAMGLDEAVDYIVDYRRRPELPVDADEWDSSIIRPATAEERSMARAARRTNDEATLSRLQNERNRRRAQDRGQMAEIQKWWLRRMIETGRPLEEKMTLFWHGHFATGYRTIEDSWHMFRQNQLFRAHATGSFADLSLGIIRDPAMLEYLDNDQNRARSPNENLARELLELFILGEGHDYSESDIKEGARALTGYTFDDDEFVFRKQQHDSGSKRILGRTGAFNGDDFVRLALARPVASEFLCWKLYRFFVNDLPGTPDKNTQGFIVKLARELREREYQLKPVLRTLFRSEHFYDRANRASVIKSPVQLVVQTVRSLRTPVRDLSALTAACDLMGQNLFYPPNVKGWDGGRSWINTATMFVRQNVVVYLLTGKRPSAYPWSEDARFYDATHLVDHLRDEHGPPPTREAVRSMLHFMLAAEPHPARVERLSTFVEEHGGRLGNDVLVGLLALIAAMPEYQLC